MDVIRVGHISTREIGEIGRSVHNLYLSCLCSWDSSILCSHDNLKRLGTLNLGRRHFSNKATLYDISLPDGAGSVLLHRDVPRGLTCRGCPLRRRRTPSPDSRLSCWQTALFEIMRMGPNPRPRMRSSSAVVVCTSPVVGRRSLSPVDGAAAVVVVGGAALAQSPSNKVTSLHVI